MSLHDHLCATKDGKPCNCPVAVFMPSTRQELLAAANRVRILDGVIEHNVPAGIITQVEFAQGRSLTHSSILAYAEQGMLQIALLNEYLNVPYSFIIQAHQAGWRYRPDARGFFKEK